MGTCLKIRINDGERHLGSLDNEISCIAKWAFFNPPWFSRPAWGCLTSGAETARLLLARLTGHRSRLKGRYFMFSHRCTLSRKRNFHLFLGDNKTLLLLSLEWPDEATMERLSSARWTIELESMLFFSSNNHATPREAAVGLKLQPQCKKLNDSDGVFFNTTAKKGFSVQ